MESIILHDTKSVLSDITDLPAIGYGRDKYNKDRGGTNNSKDSRDREDIGSTFMTTVRLRLPHGIFCLWFAIR
jgi:hypothetical protein